MKQIDIIKTYARKRCLIVDDMADVRASIKRWCTDFGCKEVDTAGNAEEAIDLCQQHRYDIVLADYNLGAGKNGQQLLEELRYHGLVSNTALFVMITAESSSHSVLHTLEYQPDDYLGKPLTRDALRKRLDVALLKAEAIFPVKQALDEHAPDKAIRAAETLLKSDGKFGSDLRRLLGELYCDNSQWLQALHLYGRAESNEPTWQRLGRARAEIELGRYGDAEKTLTLLLESVPLCVEARDLLAKLYKSQGNEEAAQHVLVEAIQISPRSVSRQRNLADTYQALGNSHLAAQALRQVLKNSKNTIEESAIDGLHLANCLNDLCVSEAAADTAELTREALETLKSIEKKYPRHPVIQIRSKQLSARSYEALGKTAQFEENLNAARDIHHNMNHTALEHTQEQLCIDCATSFMQYGHYEEGETLLQHLTELTDDPELLVQIDKLRREPQTREGILHASTLNKQGIEHYQHGDFHEAQRAFEKVLTELPNHTGLNLNLLQVLVSKPKTDTNNDDIKLIDSCLRKLAYIPENSNHYQRFSYLSEKCKTLLELPPQE